MENLEKQIIRIIENNSPELAAEEILRLFAVSGRSEQLSCVTCIFNTHSWGEDYPCATCCGFDKHQAT